MHKNVNIVYIVIGRYYITLYHFTSLYNCMYSVMQSDGNSFYGDVLDSFDLVYIDEDSI